MTLDIHRALSSSKNNILVSNCSTYSFVPVKNVNDPIHPNPQSVNELYDYLTYAASYTTALQLDSVFIDLSQQNSIDKIAELIINHHLHDAVVGYLMYGDSIIRCDLRLMPDNTLAGECFFFPDNESSLQSPVLFHFSLHAKQDDQSGITGECNVRAFALEGTFLPL